MKSISTIDPTIMENTDCSTVKAFAPAIDVKVGVSLQHGVSLSFVSLPTLQMFG